MAKAKTSTTKPDADTWLHVAPEPVVGRVVTLVRERE